MRDIIVTVILVMALVFMGGPAVQSASHQLEDVDEDHWAYEAIEQLVAAGIVEGYPDGEYKGGQTMTRYEMAMIIQRTLDNINADIEALEADVADLGDGLSAAQAADVTEIVEEMIAEKMPEASEGLTEEQAEDVTAIVKALVGEFEEELDALEAELGALEYAMETETEALWAETEGIQETLASMEGRVAELEAGDKEYEGSLTLEIDSIEQRISPETVSVDTDFSLTFDHTHYIRDGFTAYVEWSPDDTETLGEGDAFGLIFEEELHGMPQLTFKAYHDDLSSYNGHIMDQHRDYHLEGVFNVDEDLALTLGLDVDYLFDNERYDMHDQEYGKMAHLGFEGSQDRVEFGGNFIDGESRQFYIYEEVYGETFEDDVWDDLDRDFIDENETSYDFTAYEVNFKVRDVVDNLDIYGAYYKYDDEMTLESDGDKIVDYDEDYDGWEIGFDYDVEDSRYDFGLMYADLELGQWKFSDGTMADYPYFDLIEFNRSYFGGDGAELVRGSFGAGEFAGFEHEFTVEYWNTDVDLDWEDFEGYYGYDPEDFEDGDFEIDYDVEDYVFEWNKSRSLGDNTELELITTYEYFDEDILDEDGNIDVNEMFSDDGPDGEENDRISFEVIFQHEIMSW
ncbi:S-layer homology domain-containing protein [Halarsenatibacter silvermanii]|uniref:S-layer homology domain-containing protein n=1 Tax=Halarsenatibacter silvermanii TaxID=321763 RepID=A0A1G9LTA1_9FIRM|nr:S-layer homology domain-containing protein [Halarsenatibacter silvermanii]SDL65148.1 S-layer homology domain-containing protein [Halarsenatibacter silvermanii]